jgi:hypothetical protein
LFFLFSTFSLLYVFFTLENRQEFLMTYLLNLFILLVGFVFFLIKKIQGKTDAFYFYQIRHLNILMGISCFIISVSIIFNIAVALWIWAGFFLFYYFKYLYFGHIQKKSRANPSFKKIFSSVRIIFSVFLGSDFLAIYFFNSRLFFIPWVITLHFIFIFLALTIFSRKYSNELFSRNKTKIRFDLLQRPL